jgi:hypothetical protein
VNAPSVTLGYDTDTEAIRHRGFYKGFSHLFLLFNIVVSLASRASQEANTHLRFAQAMVGGSYGVISKRFPEYAVGALLSVVVAQGAYTVYSEYSTLTLLSPQVSATA